MTMTRRATTAAIGMLAAGARGLSAQTPADGPLLTRYRIATIGAPDLAAVEKMYTADLGLSVREKGRVSDATAASWSAPKSAGRPYILLSSDTSRDVYIRAVEVDPVPGYKALNTVGWNAIEIIIKDIDTLHKKLKQSKFRFIGEPAPLGRYPTIVAMQVIGPAEEVLFLTTETGDASKSSLPVAQSMVDRVFIMVGAAGDLPAMRDWYSGNFNMKPNVINDSGWDVTRQLQGRPVGDKFTTTLLYLKNHGNIMQLDGYPAPAQARPRAPGQLPPGVAMTSFAVPSLDALKVKFLSPPAKLDGAAYNGRRAATAIGAGTELAEFIEGD